jgi:Ca-activated chloride channel family protein
MKRLLILIAPVVLIMLAFRPIRSHTISGTITDEKGSPIPSVSIQVKGSTQGTISNAKGVFNLVVAKSSGTLIFSAPGYIAAQENINGRSVINVTMKGSPTLTEHKEVVKPHGRMDMYNRKIAGGAINSPVSTGYIGMDGDEGEFSREGYDNITENIFLKTKDNPLSTFSIDVDAASYSNVRRFINQGQLPPAGAVRIEEMVNYFHYSYPQPTGNNPFSINTEISDAPWNKDHKLVLIGLQGKKTPTDNLPASNLVFLIDVSGSMSGPMRLGLVKASLKMLVDQLRQEDKVSIVVYAGAAGLVLNPTNGLDKTKIKDAIDNLEAGGSTAGGAGIKLAYKTAKEQFVKGGNNRVILCTDGDFNVGVSSNDELVRMVEEERKSGVFLTVLGYGMGNYQDNKMQQLADKGNGNHAYIDGISEAKKVLVNEFGGTLFTIAKDVKLQVEFNPAKVQGYRLIGYENRMLKSEDFNDDKKDAGELGSGHTVTALYEVIPVGVKSSFLKDIDPLKYQKNIEPLSKSSHNDEILTVKFRYKQPDGDASKLIEHPVLDKHIGIVSTSENFRFAASVAQFGMLLRDSEFKSAASFESVLNLAAKSKGIDEDGYRAEFVKLVQNAAMLAKAKPEAKKEDLSVK